jgi:hypothetical protein
MKKNIIRFTAFAAVLGAAALVARARRSSSTSTTTGIDTPVQPEPQTPASTAPSPSDDHGELRVIGRIDLTQFHPGQNCRRVRIGGQPVLKSERHEERTVCNHTAKSVVKPPVKSAKKRGRRSPLDGKESGEWQMPRVMESTMILLYGDGMKPREIGRVIDLSARAVSRRISGLYPYASLPSHPQAA